MRRALSQACYTSIVEEVDRPTTPFMTRRRWIIFHTLVILLIAYVSSYFYISRLRCEQWAAVKMPGFLYVSPQSLLNDPEETWRIRNGLLSMFYRPINRFDQEVLGGPSPTLCIMTGIGPKKK